MSLNLTDLSTGGHMFGKLDFGKVPLADGLDESVLAYVWLVRTPVPRGDPVASLVILKEMKAAAASRTTGDRHGIRIMK